MIYTADFETLVRVEDCRVWAWATCEVGNEENVTLGNDINTFFEHIQNSKTSDIYYFHNLKFDGEFIFYWLYRNGFKYVSDRKKAKNKTFTTLISDTGQFYNIVIYFKRNGKHVKKVEIRDSLKLLNFSVDKIAKDFHLPILKLKLGVDPFLRCTSEHLKFFKRKDKRKHINKFEKVELGYKGFREIGHKLTRQEKMYITHDVQVVAYALKKLIDEGMTKMTIASNALEEYKKVIGKDNFRRYFPILNESVDAFIRKSYKGGYSYVADKYKGKQVGWGMVYDNNSLYPSRMHDCLLPYGQPIAFKGKYKTDKLYPLYVQRLVCQFKIKPNHLPTIQIKNNLHFIGNEYLKSSGTEEVILTLTSVDLELFFEHYDVYNIEYLDGYKFKASNKLFTKYIDKWIESKIYSKEQHNYAMYIISKLMLNSLYGKFGLNPIVKGKVPVYDKQNDLIKYKLTPEETRESLYIPVATFITSYGRYLTITSAQKVYNRYIYSDTDSIHLEGLEVPKFLEIHDTKLGAWKNELIFKKGSYIRQKTYMENGCDPYNKYKFKDINKIIDNKNQRKRTRYNITVIKDYTIMGVHDYNYKITCCGMPKDCYKDVTFENFKVGATYEGKLVPKHVRGGIVLEDSTFTIKNFKI